MAADTLAATATEQTANTYFPRLRITAESLESSVL